MADKILMIGNSPVCEPYHASTTVTSKSSAKASNVYLLISIAFVYLTFSTLLTSAQTLADYQLFAAENNPGLQVKYKAFEAAMQRVQQTGSLPDPNLSFGYFISPVETRVGPQRARFSLTQMFPWFGTLKAQKDASALMAEASYQSFLDARNKLYYQVAAAYYPLLELQQLESLEQENINLLESYKELAMVKFQNGKGTMVDVLRADIMRNDAVTNLSILQQKRKPLEVRFNNFLNHDDSEPIIIPDSLVLPPWFPVGSDSVMANPVLEALELNIKASQANEQAAIKQGLPKIGLGLDYVIVGERTDMAVPDNGKDVLMPMVTVSLPIFRKKYRAQQNEARLTTESFTLQREDLENQLSSSFEFVMYEAQRQFELVQLYEQQILTSAQSLNLLYHAYSNSDKDFDDVLRMQQQLLTYKKMKATATAEFIVRIAEMDYITAKSR